MELLDRRPDGQTGSGSIAEQASATPANASSSFANSAIPSPPLGDTKDDLPF
jgi:hypothetical protein